MDLRIRLGRVSVPADAEITDWHIYRWYEDVMGDRIGWFMDNYPKLRIMRMVSADGYSNLFEWYVDFPDLKSLIHYKLTHG